MTWGAGRVMLCLLSVLFVEMDDDWSSFSSTQRFPVGTLRHVDLRCHSGVSTHTRTQSVDIQ